MLHAYHLVGRLGVVLLSWLLSTSCALCGGHADRLNPGIFDLFLRIPKKGATNHITDANQTQIEGKPRSITTEMLADVHPTYEAALVDGNAPCRQRIPSVGRSVFFRRIAPNNTRWS